MLDVLSLSKLAGCSTVQVYYVRVYIVHYYQRVCMIVHKQDQSYKRVKWLE